MKTKFFFFAILTIVLGMQGFIYSQLPVPSNLTVTEITWMNHSSVKLEWQGSSNPMERYNIYKKLGGANQSGEFIRVTYRIIYRNFTDRMVLPDSTYSYYVTSVSPSGESDPSDTVEITLSGYQAPAAITGTLKNEINNEPIANGKVRFTAANTCLGITAFTNLSGEFSAHLVPGDYYIQSMAMGYVPEFYDNVPNIQQATLVTLNDGDSLNFDITLAPFVAPTLYTLSGNVTDNLGAPLFARVTVYPVRMNTYYQHHFVRSTFTDSLGNYSISVREGDTVVVFCKPFNRNFMPEYFDNKQTFADADRIPVTGDVTGINFSVDPLPVYENGISGIVENESNEGVDAHVAAFNLTGNHMRKYRTVTDSLGNYSFANMIPGEYILLAVPHQEYMPTFFRYDGQPTLNWRDADSVIVDLTGIVTGINFTVHPRVFDGYARVTGVVQDNSGNKINGATIFAVDDNNNMRTYAISNSDGQFILDGLVPGNYKIAGDKFGFDLDQYFNVTLDYSTNLSQNLSIT
ncbi:MAG: carboxypeptidase regulatory-like domain-containing protein, partial [Ignavibacteria bacterium]|nr:carboxypeptidase regulatory-like domain-containing protein [Ignavibacteria bacterium]